MLADTEQQKEAGAPETDRVAIIRAAIEEIRPNLKRDGGDCELLEVDGNKVMVKLTGACVFCSLASATLEGIQSKVVERLGELVRVVPVAANLKPMAQLKPMSAMKPAAPAAPAAPAPAVAAPEGQ